jgi:hypothetical protein
MRFRKAYVVSIDDIVGFVMGRARWVSTATVLRATASLVEPSDLVRPEGPGEASQAP